MVETLQKAIQIIADDPNLQAPPKWQQDKAKELKTTNPGYSQEQINTSVTQAWTALPDSEKSKAKMGQPTMPTKTSHLLEAIKIISAEEEEPIFGVDEKNGIVYYQELSGKFPDNVVKYLYKLVVVDQKGDSLGDMNFGMYYKLTFDPPLRVAEDEDTIWQEAAFIVREDKHGMVSYENYLSEEEADRAWEEIERRYENFLKELDV